jgi:hypothetical protein
MRYGVCKSYVCGLSAIPEFRILAKRVPGIGDTMGILI